MCSKSNRLLFKLLLELIYQGFVLSTLFKKQCVQNQTACCSLGLIGFNPGFVLSTLFKIQYNVFKIKPPAVQTLTGVGVSGVRIINLMVKSVFKIIPAAVQALTRVDLSGGSYNQPDLKQCYQNQDAYCVQTLSVVDLSGVRIINLI
jgi:hypothetical protein